MMQNIYLKSNTLTGTIALDGQADTFDTAEKVKIW